MAHPFDPTELGRQIIEQLNSLLDRQITLTVGFAEQQARSLAKQAAWIAEATVNGELVAEDRDWFLDNLKTMSENFVRTIVALTLLTIEQAWNAVVGTIWGAINNALDAAIGMIVPTPAAPSR